MRGTSLAPTTTIENLGTEGDDRTARSDGEAAERRRTRRLGHVRRWLLPGLMLASAIWLSNACAPRAGTIDSYLGTRISETTITDLVERRMEELGIPGLSLAIINDGNVAYAETFGLADVEAGQPITDDTIFEGASLSKPVFAHFVMTFVEEGLLDLDRPLHQYLAHPDVHDDERAEAITARMVLSHRSGFPNWRPDRLNGDLTIGFEPGTDFGYSGEGFQYLAMVLREIAATDWAGLEELFQERIARPLGMERTVFIQTPASRADKAEPYDQDGVRVDWQNDPVARANDEVFLAPASIHTNTTDFSRWMIAVMNQEVLAPASYDQLFTRHSKAPSDDLGLSYTLGFYQPHLPLTDFYGHGGNNDGFTSFFMLDQQDNWGFVLFTNSEHGETFGEELFISLLGGPSVAWIVLTVCAGLMLIIGSSMLAIGAMWRRITRRNTRGAVARPRR